MAQQDLFGDPKENRRLEVQHELHNLLRQLAREYVTTRPTVYLETVCVLDNGLVTAVAWLDGRRVCVLNRADVHSAARDLWEQVAPGGGTR